jgi:2-pyrone-4,6-dicarboxylate lactonase
MLFALHEWLGIEHCVIVHPNCHGYDTAVTEDAIAATGGAYKGVALVKPDVSDAELKRLSKAGLCGARFHYMRHLSKGPSIDDAVALGKRLADIGWHLQVHMEASLIADLSPSILRAPCPVVIDHMGRIDASLGLEQPAFAALLRLMDNKNIWVKVSGADRATPMASLTPTPFRSPASWWPNSATASFGAPTGRIPTTATFPTTACWSIFSPRSHQALWRARRCWSTIRSASTISRRRGN